MPIAPSLDWYELNENDEEVKVDVKLARRKSKVRSAFSPASSEGIRGRVAKRRGDCGCKELISLCELRNARDEMRGNDENAGRRTKIVRRAGKERKR